MEKEKAKVEIQDLKALLFNVEAIVKILMKYLRRGYKSDEIGMTFVQIFYHMLNRHIGEEEIKVIHIEMITPSQRHASVGRDSTIISFIINIANSFLKIAISNVDRIKGTKTPRGS